MAVEEEVDRLLNAEGVIRELLHVWQERLGLAHWEIAHRFHDKRDGETVAETDAQWEYEQATIDWFLPTAAQKSDAYLERTLVHELAHVLLSPVEDAVKGHDQQCELAAERVGRALLAGWGSAL